MFFCLSFLGRRLSRPSQPGLPPCQCKPVLKWMYLYWSRSSFNIVDGSQLTTHSQLTLSHQLSTNHQHSPSISSLHVVLSQWGAHHWLRTKFWAFYWGCGGDWLITGVTVWAVMSEWWAWAVNHLQSCMRMVSNTNTFILTLAYTRHWAIAASSVCHHARLQGHPAALPVYLTPCQIVWCPRLCLSTAWVPKATWQPAWLCGVTVLPVYLMACLHLEPGVYSKHLFHTDPMGTASNTYYSNYSCYNTELPYCPEYKTTLVIRRPPFFKTNL